MWRVVFVVGAVAGSLSACGLEAVEERPGLAEQASASGAAPHLSCDEGWSTAPQGQGDAALCAVPVVRCEGATEVVSVSQCHLEPSPAPAVACCDAKPAACAADDCACLLKEGPWVDAFIAEEYGLPWPQTESGKRVCSYRVTCTPGANGGPAVLSCTPA